MRCSSAFEKKATGDPQVASATQNSFSLNSVTRVTGGRVTFARRSSYLALTNLETVPLSVQAIWAASVMLRSTASLIKASAASAVNLNPGSISGSSEAFVMPHVGHRNLREMTVLVQNAPAAQSGAVEILCPFPDIKVPQEQRGLTGQAAVVVLE